jgi:multidrug efflux pump subunit AcrB
MRSLIEYFLEKNIFLNLLSALVLIVGAYKSATMNREAFPNINFDIVTVTTIYPGASPSEVEKLITKPIEDSLKSVDGIKEIRSGSIENRSGIIITIDPNVSDTGKVVDDIKSAVDRTEDLPEDAKKPLVQEITSGRSPVIEVNIGVKMIDGKPSMNDKELHKKARELEDMLLDIPEVGRVVRKGYRDAEMHVDLNPNAMALFNVSPLQVVTALKGKNINFPGGTLFDGGKEASIRTVGEFDTEEEIAKVYVRANDAGRAIQIKEIAKVKDDFVDKEYIEKVNGLPAIGLVVIKKEKGDAISLVDKVKVVTSEFEKSYSDKLTFVYVNDLSRFIRRRLDVLISNGVQGFVLVIASLFLFLGWRVALMVAVGLPLAIGMTFIAMDFMGFTLNLISMMGLIIVIGMLVDDAIVISENIFRYIEMGIPAREACIRGTVEVIAPVTATITTTCAAFGPMLFMSGIFGKFIFSIPSVVILALLSSLIEGILILPSHVYDINKNHVHNPEEHKESRLYATIRDKFYRPILSLALKHTRKTIVFFTLAFFTSIIMAGVFGRFKLFPGGVEIFMVKITAPVGYSLEQTELFAQVLEQELAKFPKEEIENYVTRIGITQKDANDPFTKRGKNYGMVMVYLTPDADRDRSTDEILNELRDKTIWLLSEESLKAIEVREALLQKSKAEKDSKPIAKFFITMKSFLASQLPENEKRQFNIPEGLEDLKGKLTVLDFEKMQGGPPVGKPIAIEIKGDDFATLQNIAAEFKQVMTKVTGVIDIGDDYYEGKDEIRVTVNESLAAQAGITVQQIALAINSTYQGAVATTIKRPDGEVDVRVRFPEEYRQSTRSLEKVYVNNLQGNLIPISRLIQYDTGPGIAAINHLDGKRLITATANLDDIVTEPRKANMEIKKEAGDLISKYPGYRVRYGGENKDTEEALASLGRAFLVAFLIIFMILASLFRSFIQPIIVMGTIPLAFMGVSVAFITHGHYFSFLSFIGMVGLAGIVVNDSIVLVDFANQLKLQNPKISSYELLMETGTIRLRPVLLTTITTVLGIMPTAYGIGGSDPFLKPMALAIGWGLLFATSLTLILIPVVYKLNYDLQIWISYKIFKKHPHGEDLVPPKSKFID